MLHEGKCWSRKVRQPLTPISGRGVKRQIMYCYKTQFSSIASSVVSTNVFHKIQRQRISYLIKSLLLISLCCLYDGNKGKQNKFVFYVRTYAIN